MCVGGGKVIFVSNPTIVLRLGWGFDKKGRVKKKQKKTSLLIDFEYIGSNWHERVAHGCIKLQVP